MPFAAALVRAPVAHPRHRRGGRARCSRQIGEPPDLARAVRRPARWPAPSRTSPPPSGRRCSPGTLIGATAVSVLAGAREVEEQSGDRALRRRTSARSAPWRLQTARAADGWRVERPADLAVPDDSTLLLLADPFSFPIDGFLDRSSPTSSPGLPVVGGMASAATRGRRQPSRDRRPGGDADGAVGVLLPPGRARRRRRGVAGLPPGRRAAGGHQGRAQRHLRDRRAAGARAADGAGRSLAHAEDRALHGRGHPRRQGDRRGARSTSSAATSSSAASSGPTGRRRRRRRRRRRSTSARPSSSTSATPTTADEDLRALLAAANGDAALVFTCNGRGTRLFERPRPRRRGRERPRRRRRPPPGCSAPVRSARSATGTSCTASPPPCCSYAS